MPDEIVAVLAQVEEFRDAVLLFAVPEHQVQIEGRGHASQNDLWAVLRSPHSGWVSMTVEAKAGEALGDVVGDWLLKAKSGSSKSERLEALKAVLGVSKADSVKEIRYQLLHRTASALIEADRVGARCAIMLVQSFGGSSDAASLADFKAFGALMKADVQLNSIARSGLQSKVPL